MANVKILWPLLLHVFFILVPGQAWSWGKTGHCLVGSVAAQILASEGQQVFAQHRFDLCYYNNVPDLIWKAPATYDLERGEHFFDLEPILAFLKANGQTLKDLSPDRRQISDKITKQGTAPWRVHELSLELEALQKKLKEKSSKSHRDLQGKWLVTAGVLGHYVADLAQPLHCTENYNGQLTGQKGIHEYFETKTVEALYPEIEVKVLKKALSKWPKFSKSHRDKSAFELSVSLCQSSLERVPAVLNMDKKIGRNNPKAYTKAAAKILEERLVLGALHLAEIWRRSASWNYDGKKFYFFEGAPAHIPPGLPKDSSQKGRSKSP